MQSRSVGGRRWQRFAVNDMSSVGKGMGRGHDGAPGVTLWSTGTGTGKGHDGGGAVMVWAAIGATRGGT